MQLHIFFFLMQRVNTVLVVNKIKKLLTRNFLIPARVIS